MDYFDKTVSFFYFPRIFHKTGYFCTHLYSYNVQNLPKVRTKKIKSRITIHVVISAFYIVPLISIWQLQYISRKDPETFHSTSIKIIWQPPSISESASVIFQIIFKFLFRISMYFLETIIFENPDAKTNVFLVCHIAYTLC